jgi:hypothetical protein
LLKQISIQQLKITIKMSNNFEYIEKYIKENNIDELRKYIPELKENKGLYVIEDCGNYCKSVNLLNNSIFDGKLDLVKFFIEEVSLEYDNFGIANAANYGYLDVLKYLVDNSTFEIDKSACIGAACNNHVHILEYLHSKGVKMEPYLIKSAYKFGGLDSMIYLHKELGVEWPKTDKFIVHSELMNNIKSTKPKEFSNKLVDIIYNHIEEYKLTRFKTRLSLFSVGVCIGAVFYKVIG